MAPEFLPEIAAGVGYLAGLAGEWHAQARAAAEQKPVAEALAKTALLIQPEQQSLAGRAGRFLNRRTVSFIAGLAAATGAFAGLAVEQANPHQVAEPLIEIGVDHSGATGENLSLTSSSGHQVEVPASISEINRIATGLGSLTGIKAIVTVSGGNQQRELPASQITQDQPYGQSHMDQYVTTALSQTAQALPVSDGRTEKSNAAIVVITNGNGIGDPKTVANEALSQGAAKQGTPIYVVNVEGESDQTTVKNLEQIAVDTHGHYWPANHANLAEVAKEVKAEVTSYEAPDANQDSQIFLETMASISAGLAAVAYKRRRRMPINKGLRA